MVFKNVFNVEEFMYYLSYCPYQKEYHIESEREFWETTFGVFKRSKFNGA
jgi:hypothetical protein